MTTEAVVPTASPETTHWRQVVADAAEARGRAWGACQRILDARPAEGLPGLEAEIELVKASLQAGGRLGEACKVACQALDDGRWAARQRRRELDACHALLADQFGDEWVRILRARVAKLEAAGR